MSKQGLAAAACVLFSIPAMAQDARQILEDVADAMGADGLRSIQYSGTGWNAGVDPHMIDRHQHHDDAADDVDGSDAIRRGDAGPRRGGGHGPQRELSGWAGQCSRGERRVAVRRRRLIDPPRAA